MSYHTNESLRQQLSISKKLWSGVRAAARDAHMDPRDYCRLMILSAAGFGGVCEHLARANDASFHADQSPGLKVTVKR